jgi:hypothetical protein
MLSRCRLSHVTGTIAVAAALYAIAAPASARVFAQASAGRTAEAAGSAGAVTVSFTVRPVIVLLVDDNGTPKELWTNIPGQPTGDDLQNVQARLDDPRGMPVAIGPALQAQLPDIFAAAAWGHQGLVWR